MSGDAVELVVMPSGNIKAIYSERIDLAQFGKLSIRRGSHVEPTENGQWTADLSPCNGPLLGPFASRSEALAAEVSWLSEHWLNQPVGAEAGHDAHEADCGADDERVPMALYHVTNIIWDTDDEDGHVPDLPDEVLMHGDPERFTDLLSDHYGWCVSGLDLLAVDAKVSDAEFERLSELPFLCTSPL
jgi:hypothetical protein